MTCALPGCRNPVPEPGDTCPDFNGYMDVVEIVLLQRKKESRPPLMTVWFTSDLHIGHRWAAEDRGHPDTDTHDAQLAERWDAVVRPADQVWVLGDISVGGNRSQHNALAWFSERPGVKHLIAGNHDGCHPMHRNAHKWMPLYMQTFASVAPAARRRIGDNSVLLSHFPYRDECVSPHRHDQWKLPDCGVPILHGHTHSAQVGTQSTRRTPQVHVGVDAWGEPVSLEEIASWLQKFPIPQPTHPVFAAREALAPLKELHKRTTDEYGRPGLICDDCDHDWPCPTARLIYREDEL